MEAEEPGEGWVDSSPTPVRLGRKHRRSLGCWLRHCLTVTDLLIFHKTFKTKDGERPPGPHVEERTNSTRAGRAGGVRLCASASPQPTWPKVAGSSCDENLCLGKMNYHWVN